MKEKLKRLKEFYDAKNIGFYLSLFAPFAMGTIHLISVLIHFDYAALSYCLFSYLIVPARLWQWAIEKRNFRPNGYLAGILSVAILSVPMMTAFVLTILFKDAPIYLWDWLIYAYAFYGTVKMVMAVRKRIKARKGESVQDNVLSWIGLLSALYTIQMMEFRLIKFASSGEDHAMYLMQLFTQGAIFLFALFVIGYFLRRLLKTKKEQAAGLPS